MEVKMRRANTCFYAILAIAAPTALHCTSQDITRGTPSADVACEAKGEVLNSVTGQGLRNAIVTFRASRTDGTPHAYLATTDLTGHFAISGIVSGTYRLSASRRGFITGEYNARTYSSPGTALNVACEQGTPTLTIRLVPYAVVTGRVIDEDDDPIEGIHLQLIKLTGNGNDTDLVVVGSAVTDDEGGFRIGKVPPGKYYLSNLAGSGPTVPLPHQPGNPVRQDWMYAPSLYRGSDDLSGAVQITVIPGTHFQSSDFRIDRKPNVRLKGKVTIPGMADNPSDHNGILVPPGRSMISGFVRLERVVSGGISWAAKTAVLNPSGTFGFDSIEPGTYVLLATVSYGGASMVGRQTIEVGPTEPGSVEIAVIPTMTLSGKVEMADHTPPKLSKQTTIELKARGGNLAFSEPRAAMVAPDGTFQVTGVSPQYYDVRVSDLPGNVCVQSIAGKSDDELSSGIDLTNGIGELDIVLDSSASTVTGLVRGTVGEKSAGAAVLLVPEEAGRRQVPYYYRATTSNEGGHFTFTGVPPGDYTLYAMDYIEGSPHFDRQLFALVDGKGERVHVLSSGTLQQDVSLIVASFAF